MDNLAKIAKLARQKGLSYGKYQALYGKPIQKKEEPAEKKQHHEYQRFLKICPWCGEEFYGKSNQTYCKPFCQKEAGKQRARERNAAAK